MPGRSAGRLAAAAADYGAHLRAFSPGARLFLGAATLAGINGGVASVLLNLYIRSIVGSDAALGRVLQAGPAGAILAGLLAGPLIDAWGPKRSMLAGTAVAGAGAVLLLASSASLALSAGLALTGMGTIFVYIAAAPLLVRHSTPRERKHLFAVTAAAYVVSTATGSVIGGVLPGAVMTLLGTRDLVETYRISLFAGAILSAAGIPLLILVREGPGAAGAPQDGLGEADGRPSERRPNAAYAAGALGGMLLARLRALPALLRARRRDASIIGQFILADSLIRVGGNLFVPFFNVYFVEHLGATTAWYGTLRFFDRVIVVVATLLVAPLAVRFGTVATITLTQLLSVPLMLAFGYSPALGLASATFLARGALMEMTVPVRDSFLMEVVPARVRATANASLALVGQAIAFVTVPVGARLLGEGRYGYACAVAGALYVVSAVLYWSFFRNRPEAAPLRTAGGLAPLTGALDQTLEEPVTTP